MKVVQVANRLATKRSLYLQNPHDFRYDKWSSFHVSRFARNHAYFASRHQRGPWSPRRRRCGRRDPHGTCGPRPGEYHLATGTSQFEVLARLVAAEGIDWPRVTVFHLDEYLGLSMSHPASFRGYLKERFVDRLPQSLEAMHYIMAKRRTRRPSVPALARPLHGVRSMWPVGIGENGHLAFNDPPADFETDQSYLVLDLDEACRRQQLGEGWFATLDDVPSQAISMSIRQIMRSQDRLQRARSSQSLCGAAECTRRGDSLGARFDLAGASGGDDLSRSRVGIAIGVAAFYSSSSKVRVDCRRRVVRSGRT